MRFHVLGIPHTVTHAAYSSCAFTQKVLKLCAMLRMEGHAVIHYGHQDSVLPAGVRNVVLTSNADLNASYPCQNWRNNIVPAFALSDPIYQTFTTDAVRAIRHRAKPGDMLLCSFGEGHRAIAAGVADLMPAVETGIGYPSGTFASYKVYESYAIMHAYMGNAAAGTASNDHWYDAVIPNAFDTTQFPGSHSAMARKDYLLFMGRLGAGKGLHIALDLAKRTDRELVVAGQGNPKDHWDVSDSRVHYQGVVGPAQRAALMQGARATICASTFLEPFCGVQVESMLCGTPVISSDFGAFAEYNLHGITGYRCRTMEQFEFAVGAVDDLNRAEIFQYARAHFSLGAIAPRYDEYLRSVQDVQLRRGWYEPNPLRKGLAYSSHLLKTGWFKTEA